MGSTLPAAPSEGAGAVCFGWQFVCPSGGLSYVWGLSPKARLLSSYRGKMQPLAAPGAAWWPPKAGRALRPCCKSLCCAVRGCWAVGATWLPTEQPPVGCRSSVGLCPGAPGLQTVTEPAAAESAVGSLAAGEAPFSSALLLPLRLCGCSRLLHVCCALGLRSGDLGEDFRLGGWGKVLD